MRLTALLIFLVLIAICTAKSSKKTAKSKPSKVIEIHKHKDAEHKNYKGHKTGSKKHDSIKKGIKHQKSVVKAANKTTAEQSSNATDDKIANKTISVEKKGNNTQAILAKGTPSNCQSIVDDYSSGKLLMYEYKIQMKRCMNKPKYGERRMQVPGLMGYQSLNAPTMMNYNMPATQQQGMPGQQTTTFYSNMGQSQFNAAPGQIPAPVPQQTQAAAFSPSAMNQQYQAYSAPFQSNEPNMAMNAVVAKSNIPYNTQNTASQANAVFDQWRASSFGGATSDKKDQIPYAPAAPANDPFAEFMKMQSSSSNSLEAPAASQQAVEQRSDIPQQPGNMFPMQAQTLNAVAGQGQAFYMQPEENGDFPENP